MENVHVAPPPLPPLRRKTENSHLTAFAAFWEIPDGKNKTSTPRRFQLPSALASTGNEAVCFALDQQDSFLQNNWKEWWQGVEGTILSDAS